MKNFIIAIATLAPLLGQSLEYQVQLDNEQVNVARVVIEAGEEIGLHRDALPQVVVALKGGTITRFEKDGSKTEVVFPTNQPVFRPVDPEGEMHTSKNTSNEAVELLIIQLKE